MAKSWGETDAPQSAERKDIERIKLGDVTTIRLVGNVLARYVYWVTTTEGRKMPVECLKFNRDTESFDDSLENPMAEVPAALFSDKEQFAYVCNVIDRADGKVKLFDVKKTVYNQILKFARNADYGNPAEEDKGYDIIINRERTGNQPQNVKYTCMPARNNSPLTDEEKELTLYDLDSIIKRPTYQEQKEWLIKNTSYFMSAENQDLSPGESAEDL